MVATQGRVAPQSDGGLVSVTLEKKPLATTVVGSYSVPEWLGRLKNDYYQRRISAQSLNEIHDVAIKAALKDQELAGLDIVSDGELRRDNDIDYLLTRIDGIHIPDRFKTDYYDYYEAQVSAPLPEPGPVRPGLAADFAFTREQTRRPVKFSFTGPFSLSRRITGTAGMGAGRGWARSAGAGAGAGRAQRGSGESATRGRGERNAGAGTAELGGGKHGAYADPADLVRALARWLNAQARELAAAGADLLQIDEPFLAGYPEQVELAIEAVNIVTAGVPATWALHVCYGNRYARPLWEGHYDFLFPVVASAHVDALVLEFARKGLGDLRLLREHGWDRYLGLGVIDVKSAEVESPGLVAARIRRALEFIPPQRLMVNPDCGLRHVPAATARAKLHAMVAGAAQVRAELGAGQPASS